jgi:hypothetical protein
MTQPESCEFCGALYECAHKKDPHCNAVATHLKRQRQREVRGKRTSEGYKPEPDEKVELRGD